MKYQDLIEKMTLEEKASLLSGKDYWHTKAIDRLGIPSIMVTDGPHGLRKQTEKSQGIHDSVKSTCFPTAVTTCASWDTALVNDMGKTLGEEALQEQVGVVLGPGVNIKRSPLCGRNFEYYSEDPYLAGEMAAGFINGIESQGIGTSLKHFAGNSQEERRMTISSTIDMRTLREIYLTQFEIAVKKAKPATLMCSYNRINGVYSSENPLILNEILRDEWGYHGAVMTDWGAVNERPLGVKAGLDLEMPGCNGINDDKIVEAVQKGDLDEKYVDIAVDNMLSLIMRCKDNMKEDYKYDIEEHNKIAEHIAMESAVLLKNNGILPLDKSKKILVVGSLAKYPRYQGAGSSHICSHKVTSLLDGLTSLNIAYDYADGYTMDSNENSEKARTYAVDMAKNYDTILVCAGLTDEYEAEGFDRTNLDLPVSHNDLIDAIAKLGKKIVVNIECGSPVLMPWLDQVDGVLLSYLGGQATGSAAAKLLFGDANPCGKLGETFPLALEDTPCYHYFPGDGKSVQYREGVYVGYRYYQKAHVNVLFPFGYGLSYTTFSYNDIKVDKEQYNVGDIVKFSVNISNTGKLAGKEIVEVYISPRNPNIDRPLRELKAFKKVYIESGKDVDITFELDKRAFSYFDIESNDFIVDKGLYDIIVSKDVNDTSLVATIEFVDGNTQDKHLSAGSWYNVMAGNIISDEDFKELYRAELPTKAVLPKKGEFTRDNCFADMMPSSWLARRVASIAKFGIRKVMHVGKNDSGLAMMYGTFLYSPLRSIPATSQGLLSNNGIDGMVTIFNGHLFKGLNIIFKDMSAQKKRAKALKKKEKENK